MHRAPVLHVYWVKGIILSSKMLSVVWAFHSPPANVTAGSSEQCVKRLKFLWYLQLQLLSRSLWTEKYNHFCDHHCLVLDAIVWMWDSRSSQDLRRIKLGNWQLTWKSEEEAGWWLGLMGSSGDCWYLFRLVCYFCTTPGDNGLLKHSQCPLRNKKGGNWRAQLLCNEYNYQLSYSPHIEFRVPAMDSPLSPNI